MDIEKPLQETGCEPPLLSAKFYFHQQLTDLSIYPEYIVFFNQTVHITSNITPDSIYDIQANQGTYKLTFFCPQPLEFQTKSSIEHWDEVLITIMKRKKFHQFFKGIRKIGKGNFASVYLTEKYSNNKLYAVKAFQKSSTYKSHNGKEGLENEISILRKLKHKNIPTLEGVYQSENSVYVTLEYIHGKNLGDIFQEQKVIPLKLRKKIIKDLLSAIQQMASKNIVHRDIKPQNIMVENGGVAKLVDFGLATDVRETEYLYVRCGTPGFVAPEIISIRDSDKIQLQTVSDIFSAGAVFYQMIYGTALFPGDTNNEVLQKNRKCLFSIPSLTTDGTFQEINLLRRMLDIYPETRITASQALKSFYFRQQREPFKQIPFGSRNLNSLPPLKYSTKPKSKYQANYEN